MFERPIPLEVLQRAVGALGVLVERAEDGAGLNLPMGALALAGLLALLIGVILGLLGAGGGILAVPLLIYVVGVAAKPAIATSLFFVGATSAVGVVLAARERRVRWKLGGLFGASSMGSAFLGGKLAHFVPERVLLATLASVMLVTALAMLRGREAVSTDPRRPIAVASMLAIGAAVGVVSGLVGAGGGFLIVPALTLFGGLPLREAIGTSLLIIAAQSFAGFAGHAPHVELDWHLVTATTGSAGLGMVVGSALGKRASAPALKRGFAVMVFATGSFVLGRQLPVACSVLLVLAALLGALFVSRAHTRPSRPPIKEKECIHSPSQP